MILNYNLEKIEKLSNDFLIATGVKLGVYDVNFNLLNLQKQNNNKYCGMIMSKEGGRFACRRSDRALLEKCKTEGRVVMHICHAGLVDLGFPIIHEKKIIAYLVLGQIKPEEGFPNLQEKTLFASEELETLQEYYKELPSFKKDKIESILNVATMVVRYILFENMLIPKFEPLLDRVLSFINENIEKNLTISEISQATLVPKSTLYKMFHAHLGCTVSEYISSKRVERAVDLLINTDRSVAEISEGLGFSSQQYFSKTFKKFKGVSPAWFRKSNQ